MREKFWSRRYQAIVVSDEEEGQAERLKYVLEHGCKEGFVLNPGATSRRRSIAVASARWSPRSKQRPSSTTLPRVWRRPAPAFHAASKAVRRALKNAYALFYAAFRRAADELARGNLTVEFPPGSFPPARRFVLA